MRSEWNKGKGWSAKQIAENKEVDEGYVDYVLSNNSKDGLYSL